MWLCGTSPRTGHRYCCECCIVIESIVMLNHKLCRSGRPTSGAKTNENNATVCCCYSSHTSAGSHSSDNIVLVYEHPFASLSVASLVGPFLFRPIENSVWKYIKHRFVNHLHPLTLSRSFFVVTDCCWLCEKKPTNNTVRIVFGLLLLLNSNENHANEFLMARRYKDNARNHCTNWVCFHYILLW